MIREALELLTRPLRRRRWNARRTWIISAHRKNRPSSPNFNPLDEAANERLYSGPLPEIPCAWEDRDLKEIKQDVHRYIDQARIEFKKKQTFLIDPKTARVARHDRETDLVDLGDGQFARLAEIEWFYEKNAPRWHPLDNSEDVSGPPEFMEAYAQGQKIAFFKKAKAEAELVGHDIFAAPHPDQDDGNVLLPCNDCGSMVCQDPVKHFGATYEDFRNGTWQAKL